MKEPGLFDFPQYQINKKIRLIELFGGIGSQAMALEELGIDFETYKLIEFDKFAIKSYNAIHNTNFEVMDIRNVHGKDLEIRERERFTYIMTYSFPCTDLSVAGRMKGMSKEDWESENSTRSGLLWEVERILKELPKEELPDVLLMENVPQVHADKNEIDFNNWLAFLRGKGYQNYYQDLNAKDFGIPQNRERTFCVSILSDDYFEFEFPEVMKLNYAMRDFLEEEVDEKYYVNSEKAKDLISKLVADGTLPVDVKKNDKLNYLGNIRGGANSTRICRECLQKQRTITDNSCKGLQRTDSDIIADKSVILGIIDPEGYDKENRVYSGGGVVLLFYRETEELKRW